MKTLTIYYQQRKKKKSKELYRYRPTPGKTTLCSITCKRKWKFITDFLYTQKNTPKTAEITNIVELAIVITGAGA